MREINVINQISKLDDDFKKIKKKYQKKRHKKLKKIAKKISPFSKGDIVYNVCGVIKVEKITYYERDGYLTLSYKGPKYKWIKGGLVTPTGKHGGLMGDVKKLDPNKEAELSEEITLPKANPKKIKRGYIL